MLKEFKLLWKDHWRDIVSVLLIIAVMLVLSGCGYVDREIAKATGFATVCDKEKGVEYLQLTSGASVRYNPDGSIVRCK